MCEARKRKNILIISTPDINQASGVIAYDLHKGLSKIYNSQLLIKNTKEKEKGIISYYNSFFILYRRVINKLFKNKKIKIDPNYYFFDINQDKELISLSRIKRIVNKPDCIIAYFMQGFFTIKDLYKVQKYYKAPVLLVMADMAYITGGCHYAWDCEGYKNDCSNCPAILQKEYKHYASDNLELNNQLIQKMNISIVSGSSQDFEKARESIIFKNKKIFKILGIINTNIFTKYANKAELKNYYNIEFKSSIILFGATKIDEKRKGLKYFIEAINYLEDKTDKNITIISIGRGDLKEVLPNTRFKIINIGYVDNYKKLAEVYNLADVFVTTTIQDSGPMMINQSIACGTPVVCFNIGIAKDIVVSGVTGCKSELYDTMGMAINIARILNMPENKKNDISKECVKFAEDKFSLKASNNIFTNIISTITNE